MKAEDAYDAIAHTYDAHFLGTVDRAEDRIISVELKRFMSRVKTHPKEVLDVGCGTGYVLDQMKGSVGFMRYTGLDVSEKMIKQARIKHPSRKFIHDDIANLGYLLIVIIFLWCEAKSIGSDNHSGMEDTTFAD